MWVRVWGDSIKAKVNMKKPCRKTLHNQKERLEDFDGLRFGDLGVKLTGGNGFQMNKYGDKMHPIFSRKKRSHPLGKSDSWMIRVERWG